MWTYPLCYRPCRTKRISTTPVTTKLSLGDFHEPRAGKCHLVQLFLQVSAFAKQGKFAETFSHNEHFRQQRGRPPAVWCCLDINIGLGDLYLFYLELFQDPAHYRGRGEQEDVRVC